VGVWTKFDFLSTIFHIRGLEDSTTVDCLKQADEFFQNHLNLKIPILQSFRLGSTLTTTGRTPPLLVTLSSLPAKLEIFKRCKRLSATKFSIQDDLSIEERRERNRKLPIYKQLKSQNNHVRFRGAELYVNGKIRIC